MYHIFDLQRLKFLTRLRLGLGHLNEHGFRHKFRDCMDHICSCSLEIEETPHYLLDCHNFSHNCVDLINTLKSVFDDSSVFLTIIRKMCFYMVTLALMATKLNFFLKQL